MPLFSVSPLAPKQKEFEELLQNAKPLIEFHFSNFEGGTNSTQQLNSFARETVYEISKIPIFCKEDEPFFRISIRPYKVDS